MPPVWPVDVKFIQHAEHMFVARMVAAFSVVLEMSKHHRFAVSFVRHFRHDNLDRDISILAILKEISYRPPAGGGAVRGDIYAWSFASQTVANDPNPSLCTDTLLARTCRHSRPEPRPCKCSWWRSSAGKVQTVVSERGKDKEGGVPGEQHDDKCEGGNGGLP